MKRTILLISLLAAAFTCAAQPTEYRTERDISYLHDPASADDYRAGRCKLDICYPVGAEEFATVVWFHGGGLEGGSKHLLEDMLNHGYAVVSVNYRLSPRATNPAYTEDAAEAVAWVFENIDRFGGSRDKIYISGHSAGGYLTLMLALDKSYLGAWGIDADDLAGAFPISGQTTTHYTIRKERGLPSDVPVIDRFAPSNNMRKTAMPIVLITGGRDLEMLARYEENLHLYALLKSVGQDVELLEMNGFDHGSVYRPACILIDNRIRTRENLPR